MRRGTGASVAPSVTSGRMSSARTLTVRTGVRLPPQCRRVPGLDGCAAVACVSRFSPNRERASHGSTVRSVHMHTVCRGGHDGVLLLPGLATLRRMHLSSAACSSALAADSRWVHPWRPVLRSRASRRGRGRRRVGGTRPGHAGRTFLPGPSRAKIDTGREAPMHFWSQAGEVSEVQRVKLSLE